MAEITRTNTETVARVTSANKKITVTGLKALTIEESRELRAALKAEEKRAAHQSHWATFDYVFPSKPWSFHVGI